MTLLPEIAVELTECFYRWEMLGRGTLHANYPVALEPPVRPFSGHVLPRPAVINDGRRVGFLASLLGAWRAQPNLPPVPLPTAEEEPEADAYYPDGSLHRFRLHLPREFRLDERAGEGLLRTLAQSEAPISWEIGGAQGVRFGIGVREGDLSLVRSAFRSFVGEVSLEESEDDLAAPEFQGERACLELSLSREWMLPLRPAISPPLLGVLGALSEVGANEGACLQLLFSPAKDLWRESAYRALRTPAGDPFFLDAPELTRSADEKLKHPLFAVSIRLVLTTPTQERLLELLRLFLVSLLSYPTEDGNGFVPHLGEYRLVADIESRVSHRTGMLLSLPELLPWVPLAAGYRLPAVLRGERHERVLPQELLHGSTFLGLSPSRGRKQRLYLPEEAKLRHTHLIGATGTGKSTLLLHLIGEDIRAGRPLAVIDPHGDLAGEVLARIPEERLSDLLYLDPADPEIALGWNLMEAKSDREREVLASDLAALFRRYATSWGDQMDTLLSSAIGALLSLPERFTLSDLRRFLVDKAWRSALVSRLRDPELRFFWESELPIIGERSLGPILGRLGAFLRNRVVRETVAAKSAIDFGALFASRGILIARLSQGLLGEESAALLGSLLLSRFHQTALAQESLLQEARGHFTLYLDEFHLFTSPSLVSLLSGARKYGLSLVLAHQSLRALSSEIESALLANIYTRIIFRVGEEDAQKLSRSLGSFGQEELLGLKTGEAICRLGTRESDFLLEVVEPEALGQAEAVRARERNRAALRERFPREKQSEAPELLIAVAPPTPPVVTPLPVAPPFMEKKPLAEPARPPIPVRPGKGGAEHTYLQELIKRSAEDRGFRAGVEEQVESGRESVDVALYRGDLKIAVEISVTTPPEHEVENVRKCLRAGFGTVAVVSLKKGHLEKIGKLLKANLSEDEFKQVSLFTPEEFLAWLMTIPADQREGEVRGYKVKVRYRGAEDARSKRVTEILARSVRKLDPRD